MLYQTTKVEFKKFSYLKVYWPETVLGLGWIMKNQSSFFVGFKAWKGLKSYAQGAGRHTKSYQTTKVEFEKFSYYEGLLARDCFGVGLAHEKSKFFFLLIECMERVGIVCTGFKEVYYAKIGTKS